MLITIEDRLNFEFSIVISNLEAKVLYGKTKFLSQK